MSCPAVKLVSGFKMPLVGLGTWKSKPGKVQAAVLKALEAGYRHIDAAAIYGNETEVGVGIKSAIDRKICKREDIFVTSKLWNTEHDPKRVKPALEKTLKDLGLGYLDLYLIHWPTATNKVDGSFVPADIPNVSTWKALEACVDAGLVRSIGLSNFNKRQVEEIIKAARIPPSVNQIESNPYIPQNELITFCKERKIQVTAYSPLGSGDRPWAKEGEPKLLEDETLAAIAKKYNKTAAQVCIRYQVEREVIVIPKSVTPSRIVANFDVLDFKLSAEDMKALESTRFFRSCVPTKVFKIDGKDVLLPRDLKHPEVPCAELLTKFKDYRSRI